MSSSNTETNVNCKCDANTKCCEQCPYCNKENPNNLVTNVPTLTWEDTGICLPEESDILKGVIEDFQTAFQNKLKFYNQHGEFLLSTPQGQLATSMAAIISDRNRLLAYYLNQVDPSYAVGRMQDGIGRIYFIERRHATQTTVNAVCHGGVGVVIPSGTAVQDSSGNIYESTKDCTIGDNNKVNVTFTCTEYGPIECPANSLSMYQLIQGWDSVENPKPGTIGREVESQAQFEQRRRLSVAGNAVNSVDSIQAALLNLLDDNDSPVCDDAYVMENSTSESIDGNTGKIIDKSTTKTEVDSTNTTTRKLQQVSLKPHSIYVCVAANIEADANSNGDGKDNKYLIAKTIWSKKPPGCDMNGNISEVIIDDTKDDAGKPLYETPPQYTITYQAATKVSVYFYIHMSEARFKPNNAVELVQNAVKETFNGQDGSAPPRIGSQVLASSFYDHIQSLGNWSKIRDLKISYQSMNSESEGYSFIQMGIDEMPVVDISNIKVKFDE